MMKKSVTVCAVLALAWTGLAWQGSSLNWAVEGAQVTAKGIGDDFLEAKDGTPYRSVTVTARVTPKEAKSGMWATLGVAIRLDDGNFWHLAFVRSPVSDGSARFIELSEMRDGRWLANMLDGLPMHEAVPPRLDWAFGKTYELEISLSPNQVRGVVRDAAGKTLLDRTYRTEGRPAVKAGMAAFHRTGSFCGTFTDVRIARREPAPELAQREMVVPPYSGRSFTTRVTGRKTGFFHTEQIDGRWWVIDPLGRGYVTAGCDHIHYNGHGSTRTSRLRYRDANDREFKDRDAWADATVKRLLDWGFNQLGAGSDARLRHRGLSHTVFLSMGDSLCWDKDDDAFYILPNERRPCSAFPNVFHPDFPAWCDSVARKKCRPMRNDPWLYGYFLDNEFAWWGLPGSDLATGLYDATAALRPDHTARQALEAFTAARVPGGTAALAKLPVARQRAVKQAFLRECAERYFATSAAAIRRHDPNHMILGARFAGLTGADPVVWEVAGRYSDIVTFNCYPWCDFNRGVIFEHNGQDARLLQDAFAEMYALTKKPIQITEWSFPALDTGRPCLHGAGQRVATQKERVYATELCARTMLAMPFLVGYDYFMWVDQPAEGCSDPFPEDTNYGLLSIDGVPHAGITKMFANLQKDIGAARFASYPVPKAEPAGFYRTADEAWTDERRPSVTAACARDGARYRVTTSDGLVATGAEGGRFLFDAVVRKGIDYGPAFAMMSFRGSNGATTWIRTDRVASARWDDAAGRLDVVLEGRFEKDRTFSASASIRFAPDGFLVSVADVANTGKTDFEIQGVFLCVQSPFARESATAAARRPPNMWQTERKTGWYAHDGRFTEVTSRARTVWYLNYRTSKDGIHPDAVFFFPGATTKSFATLKAGARRNLEGHAWARFRFGKDAYKTDSIQAWIDAKAAEGGGRVTVPPGTWDVGKIHLRSNVELHLSEECVLRFSSDPKDYLPMVKTSWQGEEMMNYSPLVYAYGVTNVAITGKGLLKTENKPWREWFGRDRSRRRPQFIQFFGCRQVRLEDFSIEGTPFWTVHLYRTEDVTVKNLTVTAFNRDGVALMNSDGLDIECSRRVRVSGCSFTQDDDAIVLKSGRDLDGIRRGIPTEDVLVENCVVPKGHVLFAIGSEVGGGVRNVTMRNCRVHGSVGRLLFVKTNAKRGGFIENIVMEDIEADGVRDDVVALMADYWYYPKPGLKNLRRTPIRGVTARNITVKNAACAVNLRGDPDLPARDFTIENVRIGTVYDEVVRAQNVENLRVDGLSVGRPPRRPFKPNDPTRGGPEPD